MYGFATRHLFLLFSFLLIAPAAKGQTVVQTLPVGTNPQKVAINPVTGTVYVANAGSYSISVVNGLTHTVSLLALGAWPLDLAVNPASNKIYVLTNGAVKVIDGATDTISATITGSGNNPSGITLDSSLNRVFVANGSDRSVTVINGANDLIIGTILISGTPSFKGIGVNPDTHYVYVAANGSDTVEVIDGQTAVYKRSIALSLNVGPVGIAVNPVTNKIYVSTDTSVVEVINGETDVAAATFGSAVVTGPHPGSVVVNPVTNKVYSANLTGHSLTVINGAIGATPASAGPTLILNATAQPNSLVVDPSGNKVFINDPENGAIHQLDGATNTITNNFFLLKTTGALALNPLTGRLFIALPSNSQLAVLDSRNNAMVTTATVAGGVPIAVAANRVSGKTYIANTGSNSLTVLVPAAANKDVPLGGVPVALMLNPVTNRIYALLDGGAAAGSVKVIDGATDAIIATIPVGIGPKALALNSASNNIYVTNQTSNTVTVINAGTNAVLASPALLGSSTLMGLAVNSATNRVYILRSSPLIELKGEDNSQTQIFFGGTASALAINRVSNKIYLATGASAITVVDGVTRAVTTIPTSNTGGIIAVNEASNKIYLASVGSVGHVEIADGTGTGAALASLPLGSFMHAIGINPNSNTIYITDGANNLHIIDGISDTLRQTLAIAITSAEIAVNPVTGRVYLAHNTGNANIRTVTEKPAVNIPLDVTITPFASNTTTSVTPYIFFAATSSYSPIAPAPRSVYYQVDSWQGRWISAPIGFGGWADTLAPMGYGIHTLYAWAGDGQEATSINTASSPIPGQVSAYTFVVAPDVPVITLQPASQVACMQAIITFSVTATGSGTVSYRWRKGGINLNDGGNISGATSSSLTINPVSGADAGPYDVVITNSIANYLLPTVSANATLTVDTGHTAPTEALSLAIVKGSPDILYWLVPVNGGGYPVTYDVLRSTVNGNFTNTLSTTCVATGISGISVGDSFNGTAWYLVRAKNACGSTLGVSSSGSPIQGRSCP
jgi:DNA-binding beta-propeller fold protein YncE